VGASEGVDVEKVLRFLLDRVILPLVKGDVKTKPGTRGWATPVSPTFREALSEEVSFFGRMFSG